MFAGHSEIFLAGVTLYSSHPAPFTPILPTWWFYYSIRQRRQWRHLWKRGKG